jgi:hypothetical protein
VGSAVLDLNPELRKRKRRKMEEREEGINGKNCPHSV